MLENILLSISGFFNCTDVRAFRTFFISNLHQTRNASFCDKKYSIRFNSFVSNNNANVFRHNE